MNENRSEFNENKRQSTDHRDHDRHTVNQEGTPLMSKTEDQINQTEQTETEADGGEKELPIIGAVTTRSNDRHTTETSATTDEHHRPETERTVTVTADMTGPLLTETLTDRAVGRPQRQRRQLTDDPAGEAFRELAEIDTNSINGNDNDDVAQRTQTDFAMQQRQDPQLKDMWVKAEQGRAEIKVINGLLYRRVPVNMSSDNEFALVLPTAYQKHVIKTAHSHPASGHCGVNRTQRKIATLFYFPKMRQKSE